ncbi:hypothetical protein HDV57DRAFT_491558 [Trichoderma longibrachiatum]|uniref:Uncharacterized protein n=1 Tax=Trichoderma longibrachiatum ATCC 18648 TaxID=983965 RepID=A0A2T4C205_TRILO|nr:hypothetical protein M440DRAFT_1356973 [Trichoderma longibrachiatum ATCC 18648]
MASLQLNLPNAYFIDVLKQAITMDHVQFFLFELLAFVNVILWASIQRKLLLSLTEVLSGLRGNDADIGDDDRTTCSPELDDRGVEERREDTQSLIWIVIPLYLSMYGSAPAEPLLVGIAMRSIPLALSLRFYLEWPTVSQHLLMLWAKVWLGETVLWTKSAILLTVPILSACALVGNFLVLLGRRLRKTEHPEPPHPHILAETWRVSLPMLRDVLPMMWRDFFLE